MTTNKRKRKSPGQCQLIPSSSAHLPSSKRPRCEGNLTLLNGPQPQTQPQQRHRHRHRHRKPHENLTSPSLVASTTNPASPVQHDLLSLYYPRLLTLRGYLLSRLPQISKTRRRTIHALGRQDAKGIHTNWRYTHTDSRHVQQLAYVLDTTLVAAGEVTPRDSEERVRDYASFSQQNHESTIMSLDSARSSQAEVCPFLTHSLKDGLLGIVMRPHISRRKCSRRTEAHEFFRLWTTSYGSCASRSGERRDTI